MARIDDAPGIRIGFALRRMVEAQTRMCRVYGGLLNDLAANRIQLDDFASRSFDLYVDAVSDAATGAADLGRAIAR
jgi:hypothetical protein